MEDDIKVFCLPCLHCRINDQKVIPRPFGKAVHGNERNEVLHFDFISMYYLTPKSEHLYKHVLILKNECSGFVELISATNPDHFTVPDSLMDWCKGFRVPKTRISVQGSHIVDNTLNELNRILQARQHFAMAHISCAHGAVEIVCRHLRSRMKSVLSHFKIHTQD